MSFKYLRKKVFTMKKKTNKKLLLPLFLMALCFMTMKTPVASLTMPKDTPPQVVMPLSDLEEDRRTEDH